MDEEDYDSELLAKRLRGCYTLLIVSKSLFKDVETSTATCTYALSILKILSTECNMMEKSQLVTTITSPLRLFAHLSRPIHLPLFVDNGEVTTVW